MRLLLVEDDVMVASGIKLGLTDAGYAVDWVGSGERAEEVLRNESFDAAIIDIGLPAMPGRRRRRVSSSPSMAGRPMSMMAASNDSVRSTSSARSPLPTQSTA